MSELNIKRGETQAIVEKELANRAILLRERKGSTSNIVQTGLLGKPSDDNLHDKLINSLGRFIRGENVILSKPRGLDYEPGGAYESLGNLSGRLKGVTDSGQAKELFRGVKAEFEGDNLQLGWLSEVEAIAFSHEPLAEEFGGPKPKVSYFNLSDVRKVLGETVYEWRPYIMRAGLTAVAGDSGAGKSCFMMDLIRRQWKGLDWPDGQAMEEKGRPVVYIMADQRLSQLADLATAYGVPDEAIVIASEANNPVRPLSLDDPDFMERLQAIVEAVKPWAVVVDTFTSVMGSREQSKPEAVNSVADYFHDLAIANGTAVILLCHTNASGNIYGRALGRRVEHQLSVLLSDKNDNNSGRNLKPSRSRYLEDCELAGIIWGRGGLEYGEPYEMVEDSGRARGDITVKKTIKDETSEQALSMAAMAGDKGFTQIELVNALISESGKKSEADKSKYQNQVSRAIRALIQAGKLREENRRYYQSAF